MATSSHSGGDERLLSERACGISGADNAMTNGFIRCLEDPYDPEKRPQGIINMGVSENYVMHDVMKDWFNSINFQWENSMITYNNYLGVYELREALAEFLTEHTKAAEPLNPEQVIVMNGGDTCMEALGFCLAEPNDAILCPTPYYGAIKANFGMRAQVNIFPFHLSSQVGPGDTSPFQLTIAKLEAALKEAKEQNVNIRALIVVNPHNPTGDMLTKQQIQDILMFCKRHSLHVIMDEVYMLTVFNKDVEHFSVFRLKMSELPDPQRTHFIYSFSKDFSLSALRVGCIYTWNQELIEICKYMLCFQQSAAYIQYLLAKMLRDKDFVCKKYLPTCQQKLSESHQCVTDSLDEFNIPYLCRSAGLFVWADFRKYLSTNTFEAEKELLERFLANKVYITPSVAFYGNEPGWFRIIFSRNQQDVKKGMERITEVIRAIGSQPHHEGAVNGAAQPLALNGSTGDKGADAAVVKTGDSSLEGLLSQLHVQIKDSDWLKENTTDQWKSTNPETFKAFMQEIDGGDK
ncbi:1-aminocyclopropane-1-carboxylate synthase-like protein 1 [Amphiura filiformis]|uniref:1-aminocyclopropane-1-carboxylate synthase-like protein 1 n=1 Tax=Amphiura filiformis TaxID=82378 RepID=UPI003B226D4E